MLFFQGFKNKSKLFYIAYEILTTEKTFVEALTLICEVSKDRLYFFKSL